MSRPAQIFLPAAPRQAMAAAAAAAWPAEACGLLWGTRRPEGLYIAAFRPTANGAEDPRRGYRVPPLELLAAAGEASAAGLEIVGVWHSHPGAPATPSRRDAEEAWEGYSYGIQAATREGAGELRFFAPAGGEFHELAWTTGDLE